VTRIRRVLLASDFSHASRKACAAAISMAKSNRAPLTILFVYIPIVPLVPGHYIDDNTWAELDTDSRRWIQRRLTALASRAKRSGVRASVTMAIGDAPSQIVQIARSLRIDLIVMGTHGRRGMSKFLLGSVAERVIATAPCPVMTVRGD
jgi:nucleotide-binding universal stress UspA family protein